MFYRPLLHESSQQADHLEGLAETHVIAQYRSYQGQTDKHIPIEMNGKVNADLVD